MSDESKHTPKDWELVRHTARSDYGPDAYTLWPQGVIIIGLSDADARLVQAAPKLLAASKMVVDRWEHGDLAEAARACADAIAEALPEHIVDLLEEMQGGILPHVEAAFADGGRAKPATSLAEILAMNKSQTPQSDQDKDQGMEL